MNIEEFRAYCISKPAVTESIPFSKLPDILVFKVGGKMFAVTDINLFESITVKCKPEKVSEIRAEYNAVQKPPYMNANHWNSVGLDGTIEDQLIYSWIDESYQLVLAKLPKKVKLELGLG